VGEGAHQVEPRASCPPQSVPHHPAPAEHIARACSRVCKGTQSCLTGTHNAGTIHPAHNSKARIRGGCHTHRITQDVHGNAHVGTPDLLQVNLLVCMCGQHVCRHAGATGHQPWAAPQQLSVRLVPKRIQVSTRGTDNGCGAVQGRFFRLYTHTPGPCCQAGCNHCSLSRSEYIMGLWCMH
jgi:hypothetical protein